MVEKTATGQPAWGAPKHLDAPINTKAQEFYPSVTADGTLYFSSTREGGKGRGDIWRARLVDGRYSEPENLGEAINSQFSEGDPFIAPDESYLVFVSYGRPDGLVMVISTSAFVLKARGRKPSTWDRESIPAPWIFVPLWRPMGSIFSSPAKEASPISRCRRG